MAKTAAELTGRLAFSESLVGALTTAVATSRPELVTTIAAFARACDQSPELTAS